MHEFMLLALGLVLPPLVSWIKRPEWPQWVKTLLTLGIAVLGGVVMAAVDGQLDLNNISVTSTAIFTVATVFFKAYFQEQTMNDHLEQARPFSLKPPMTTGEGAKG